MNLIGIQTQVFVLKDAVADLVCCHDLLTRELTRGGARPTSHPKICTRAKVRANVDCHGEIIYRLTTNVDIDFTFTSLRLLRELAGAMGEPLVRLERIAECGVPQRGPGREKVSASALQEVCIAFNESYESFMRQLDGRDMGHAGTAQMYAIDEIHVCDGPDGEDAYVVTGPGVQVIFTSLAPIRECAHALGVELQAVVALLEEEVSDAVR